MHGDRWWKTPARDGSHAPQRIVTHIMAVFRRGMPDRRKRALSRRQDIFIARSSDWGGV